MAEENRVIHEAMGKAKAKEQFKTTAQSFMDELGSIAQKHYYHFLTNTHRLKQ